MQEPVSKNYDDGVTVKRIRPGTAETIDSPFKADGTTVSRRTKRNLQLVENSKVESLKESEPASVSKLESSKEEAKDKFSLFNILIFVLLLALMGFNFLTVQEQRSFASRIEGNNAAIENKLEGVRDSIDSLKENIDNLGAQLVTSQKAIKQEAQKIAELKQSSVEPLSNRKVLKKK